MSWISCMIARSGCGAPTAAIPTSQHRGSIRNTFAARRIERDSTVITFNYDVALERALVRAGKWDIGTGYGFTAFRDRAASFTTIYKLHGSVNWFQAPMQQNPPPFMLTRDLKLLGYDD